MNAFSMRGIGNKEASAWQRGNYRYALAGGGNQSLLTVPSGKTGG